MGFLFGCVDPSLNSAGQARLLDTLEQTALFPRPRSAATAEACVCAVLGGEACRGPDGLLTAIAGFPRWQDSALAEIAGDRGHATALAEAYRRKGGGLTADLRGAFSLAVIDPASKTVFLALDRIGQQHLYYARTAQGLAFGSSADAVLKAPGVSAGIDPQAVFDYVYSHHCPSPGTLYRQIRKLDCAGFLLYRDGDLKVGHYWQPEFSEAAGDSDALAEELRTSIFGAVARFDGEGVGAFLSGGLDSSTVAGALAKVRPGAAETFSMGFAVEGYDEMAYARIAAEHFKTRRHEFYLTPDDAVAAIPRIAAAYDEPFGNSSALPAYFCARLAREHGITLLLGGDGGDELFGGNERYVKQQWFEPWGRLPGAVRAGLETGLRALPAALAGRFPFQKMIRYIEQAKVPLPDRLHDYNFLHRVRPAEVFADDFLAAVDAGAPLAEQRGCYGRLPEATALNRMLYLDWKITLHDNDLVKVNRMCELAGVRVAYPMLDDDVVELSCRVPSRLKIRHGKLRWFYKRAMAGFLPEAILRKSKHGFGLPFGIWLREHAPLRDLAYDSINRLKQRPYFRPEFIAEAIRMHQSGHAAYYGELVWILMMLELWFEAKAGSP